MSIESLSIAFHHSKAKGTDKLVLLGIANHDGDGGAWPAVATLCRLAGGVDRRTVQRSLDRLERMGEIRRLQGQGGDHSMADYRRPNLYRFLLVCPHECDRTKNHRMPRMSAPVELEDQVPDTSEAASVPPGQEGAATAPPGDTDAAWWDGAHAAQTIPLTDTSLIETNPSTRTRGKEDALARDDSEPAGAVDCHHDHIEHYCLLACEQNFAYRIAHPAASA